MLKGMAWEKWLPGSELLRYWQTETEGAYQLDGSCPTPGDLADGGSLRGLTAGTLNG